MKKIILIVVGISIIISSYAQIPRDENPNYTQTVFFDDFTGNELNRTIWRPEVHFGRGLEWLIDSTLTISVESSNLKLSMHNIPGYIDHYWSDTGWVTKAKDYVGGEVVTKNLEDRFKYGIFECRAKFANYWGSWPAFWIIGDNGVSICPPGHYGNEIDIAELWAYYPDSKIGHTIHWYHPINCVDTINQKDSYKYEWNSQEYHIYKCIWTHDKIRYYIDNNLKHTVTNTGQEWYPSFNLEIRLSQQVVFTGNTRIPPITPQTSYFDWVKVQQYFLAPEITCADNICSTETATLDVDEDASNITWNLTPTSLFSGATSGNGTTASISPSTSYHGLGKITFNFEMPSGESYSAEKEIRVNGPGYEDISFYVCKSTGEPAVNMSGYWLLCPNTTYHIYVNNDGSCSTSNYSWSVPAAWTQYYTYQNMISINTNSSPGGPISVNANTCCNTNITIISDYMGSYSCGYYSMIFTPNPVTNETTVEILKEDGSDELALSSEDTNNLSDIEWDLDVYDRGQNLKKSSKKIKGNKYKLKVNNWKEGVYFVRAKIKDEIVFGKFIVKK